MIKVFSLLATLFFLLNPSPANAQRGMPVESLKLEAALQKSGAIKVTQTIRLLAQGPLVWQVFSNTKDLIIKADGELVSTREIVRRGASDAQTLSVTDKTAAAWEISYQTTSTLIRHNDRDQFFYKIFEQPGVSIGQVEARLTLPEAVSSKEFAANVYAISGVAGAGISNKTEQEVVFAADSAGPKALMTINASWPKSVLPLSWAEELRLTLSNLDELPWLVLGVSLPLLATIILISLLLKVRREERLSVEDISERPPSKLSPVLVGVLVNKKIYPEEIVALLVDLCQRGYLVIIKKKGQYFLGKRQLPDENLESWEANILTQLTNDSGITISDEDVRLVSKQSLFSPQVRRAFSEIYEVITRKKYFAENPHLTRVKYKLIALGLYFFGTAGLVWAALSGASPYLLIPLIGTLLMSWVILRLTVKLIHYTALGQGERAKWLAFSKFLTDTQPLDPRASRSQMFENYLPFAIVMNKTLPWAARFDKSSSAIVSPEWFISYQQLTATELAQEMVDFTKKVSTLLSKLRGPLVN